MGTTTHLSKRMKDLVRRLPVVALALGLLAVLNLTANGANASAASRRASTRLEDRASSAQRDADATLTFAKRSSHTVTAHPATVAKSTRDCAYTDNNRSDLTAYSAMVGRTSIDCAMVFDAPPDWAGWINPYFLHHPDPDYNWAAWVNQSPAGDRRQLIISQPMIPSGLAGRNWRKEGAQGAFNSEATQFAQTLVADGVGDAIIRLGWEMNGTWNVDNIGSTTTSMQEWTAYWRHIVTAMRAVPGAHFRFDWCPNNGYRDIPLAEYYPGNKYVDIIGDDIYDSGLQQTTNRFTAANDVPGGLADITLFAEANGKPMSLPEWGLETPGGSIDGGGDDPSFITGIAQYVQANNVTFQTYFYNNGPAQELVPRTRSLRIYKQAFGAGGWALGAGDGLAR